MNNKNNISWIKISDKEISIFGKITSKYELIWIIIYGIIPISIIYYSLEGLFYLIFWYVHNGIVEWLTIALVYLFFINTAKILNKEYYLINEKWNKITKKYYRIYSMPDYNNIFKYDREYWIIKILIKKWYIIYNNWKIIEIDTLWCFNKWYAIVEKKGFYNIINTNWELILNSFYNLNNLVKVVLNKNIKWLKWIKLKLDNNISIKF